jgi:hypothetical protein
MSSTGKTDSPEGNPKTLQALVVAACISEVTGKNGLLRCRTPQASWAATLLLSKLFSSRRYAAAGNT